MAQNSDFYLYFTIKNQSQKTMPHIKQQLTETISAQILSSRAENVNLSGLQFESENHVVGIANLKSYGDDNSHPIVQWPRQFNFITSSIDDEVDIALYEKKDGPAMLLANAKIKMRHLAKIYENESILNFRVNKSVPSGVHLLSPLADINTQRSIASGRILDKENNPLSTGRTADHHESNSFLLLFNTQYTPAPQGQFPFKVPSLTTIRPTTNSNAFKSSKCGVLILQMTEFLTNSQNTNLTNIYFETEILKDFFCLNKAEEEEEERRMTEDETQHQSGIRQVNDPEETEEMCVINQKRIRQRLCFHPQKMVSQSKMLSTYP